MGIIELLILIAIFILSIVLIHKNFDAAIKVLLVLSVLLHKEVFSIHTWDYLPVRFFMLGMMIYGAISFSVWYLKTRDWQRVLETIKNPFFLTLLALWIIRAISIVNTKNLPASILILGFFSTILFLAYFFWNHFYNGTTVSSDSIDLAANKNTKVLSYIKFYIYLVFALCLFGYFQLGLYHYTGVIIGALWNVPGHLSRVGSTFWDVNHFGALLAMLLPVFGVLFLVEGTLKTKLIRLPLLGLMTLSIVLTSSRTAWIAAAVSFGIFITILLLQRFGKKGVLGLVILLLVAVTAGLVEFSDKASPFRAYIKQNFHYRLDSFASHLYLLSGSYQIFEEHPFIGGGYGSFFEHFRTTKISATFFSRDPAALNTRVPAHTIWGELIAETGILGLTTFIAFIAVLLSPLIYNTFHGSDLKIKLLSTAMFSSILGILTAGIFYSYNSEFFWITLFLYFMFGVTSLPLEVTLVSSVKKLFESKGFLLGILLLISGFLIFVNLGSTHLIPWDEAIYAKIAKTMVQTNDYFTMEWQPNKTWFEKPPLSIWFEAGLIKLLGTDSIVVRLPSAIFGFATILITYLFAKKLFNKGAGYLAGLSLVTTVHFLQYSRYAMMDVTLTFFITLCLYLYWLGRETGLAKYWLGAAVAAGLGVMTKGVVGFLPIGIIGLSELTLLVLKEQKFTTTSLRNYLTFGMTFLLVSLPWHIKMYMQYGYEFIHSYLIYHVFNRAVSAIEDKGQPWYWYFVVLKVSMRLWFVALLGAFPYALYMSAKKSTRHVFLVVWALVILIFFSAAKSKVVWYIVPIYPVLAILVGQFLSYVLDTVIKQVKILRFTLSYHLILYVITVIAIGYLFLNKELVYTTDQTGSRARLLMLKDEVLGTDSVFYISAIEEPLILYYTNSPFSGYDFSLKNGRVPEVEYDQQLILLTKRGRFPGYDVPVFGKLPKVVGEDGDYILWYYDSTKEIDRDELNEIEKTLAKPAVTDNISELLSRKTYLEKRIASNGVL